MKKIQKIALLLCLFLFFLSLPLQAKAEEAHKNISLGIASEDDFIKGIDISTDAEINIGILKESKFESLSKISLGNRLLVRKDIYISSDDKDFQDYGFLKTKNFNDQAKYIHLQVGKGLRSAEEAREKIAEYRKMGLNVFPAYLNEWKVLTGFYADEKEAQLGISKAKEKLGSGALISIVNNSKSSVLFVSQSKQGQKIEVLIDNESISMSLQSESKYFEVNKLKYRGSLEVKKINGNNTNLINVLSLEEYLYGVVPAEIGASGDVPEEAISAQAIAARTYTLCNWDKHKNQGFNLCNTEHCQVYKGMSFEKNRIKDAIDKTKGKIITYEGKPAQIFYFASSGGITEAPENVWGGKIPYLKSVDDKFEITDSKSKSWEISLTYTKIREILKSKGHDIGIVTNIEITKKTESGRVFELRIDGTQGNKIFTKSQCRSILNLPSQLYTLAGKDDKNKTKNNDMSKYSDESLKRITSIFRRNEHVLPENVKFIFGFASERLASIKTNKNEMLKVSNFLSDEGIKIIGKGAGHGVGMSQNGAIGMAKAGHKCEEILAHYFPGTKIEVIPLPSSKSLMVNAESF